MKIGEFTVDKSGRIVIPKKARDQLKLAVGEMLDIYVEGSKIIIEPSKRKATLKRKDGVLFFESSEPIANELDLANRDREERIQELLVQTQELLNK